MMTTAKKFMIIKINADVLVKAAAVWYNNNIKISMKGNSNERNKIS